MARGVFGVASVAALVFASTCGSALAAPPTDPPGKSGEAPARQKQDESAAEHTPPGQAKKNDDEPQAFVTDVTVQPLPELQRAPEPATQASPRFENASGKPKVNVPPAAEAAPQTSISAPGKSGRHKLTICHKGHAITVDVHAARAHVDGHGDTYAVAGARGRAACPQASNNEAPRGPVVRTEISAALAAAAPRAADRAVASPAAEDPAVAPPPGRRPTRAVSATAYEQRGAVAAAVEGGLLPFTGSKLGSLVLLGFGLLAAGLALVGASRTPLRRPTCSDQARSRI
jgi:hypothetical protein